MVRTNRHPVFFLQNSNNPFFHIRNAKIFSQNTSDFNNSAGIVDFLLHNHERFFQINELIKLLKKNKYQWTYKAGKDFEKSIGYKD